MRKRTHSILFTLSVLSLCACVVADDVQPEVEDADETPMFPAPEKPSEQTRADALPVESFESSTDPYLEGYIQALVDMHYYEFKVQISVKNHKVYLYNLPKNEQIAKSIISFVQDVPGVKSVEVSDHFSEEEQSARAKYVEQPRVSGVWFPQSTVLFQPLVADPREPTNFAAYRYGDAVIGKQVASVALGGNFPLFRWNDVMRWHGAMQIGIEGGIWAVFNFDDVPENDSGGCELVNTDYFLGIPLSYAVDRWSFRMRLYHISSHLGDEFMCDHPEWVDKRKNPSFEALDFISSYQASSGLRAYFGPGFILHSDKTFPMKYVYLEYGIEYRFKGQKLYYHRLYGCPFIAIDIQNWQVRHWQFDETIKIGYEIGKMQGVGCKLRLYVDFHNGFSYEGQFFKRKTTYGEVGFSWGF